MRENIGINSIRVRTRSLHVLASKKNQSYLTRKISKTVKTMIEFIIFSIKISGCELLSATYSLSYSLTTDFEQNNSFVLNQFSVIFLSLSPLSKMAFIFH